MSKSKKNKSDETTEALTPEEAEVLAQVEEVIAEQTKAEAAPEAPAAETPAEPESKPLFLVLDDGRVAYPDGSPVIAKEEEVVALAEQQLKDNPETADLAVTDPPKGVIAESGRLLPEEEAPPSRYAPQAGSSASMIDGPEVAVTSSGSPPPAGSALVFTAEDVRKAIKDATEQLTDAIATILEKKASEFSSSSKGRSDMSLCATEFTLTAARVRGLSAKIDLHHTVAGHDN